MERKSEASSSQSKSEIERVLRDPSLKNISLAKGLELVIPSGVNYIENSEILKFISQKPSDQSTSHGLEKGAEANLHSSSSHLTRSTSSRGPIRKRNVASRRGYNRKDKSSWSGDVAPYPYYTPSRPMSSQVMIPTPQHGINFIVGSTQAGTTWISQQPQQNTYSFAGANQSYPNFNNFCPPIHLNQFATPIAAGQYGVNPELLFNEWKMMSMIYQQSMYAPQHGINAIDANMISLQQEQGNTNISPAGFHQSLSNFNNFCTQGNPAYLNQSAMTLAAEQNMQSIAAQYGGEQLQQPVAYGIPLAQQNGVNNTGDNMQGMIVPQHEQENTQQTLVGAHQFPTNSNNLYTSADRHVNQFATPVAPENGISITNRRSENVPLAQENDKEVMNVQEQKIQNLARQESDKLEGRMEGTGEVLPVSSTAIEMEGTGEVLPVISTAIETACLNPDDELDAILREWETIGS